MEWARYSALQTVALVMLWGLFCLITFVVVVVGYAVLTATGAVEGAPGDSFAWAWGVGTYIAAVALLGASLFVYGGLARINREGAPGTD